MRSVKIPVEDIERLYRTAADHSEPRFEILQLIYDLAGVECGLRPPADEARLAGRCSGSRAHG